MQSIKDIILFFSYHGTLLILLAVIIFIIWDKLKPHFKIRALEIIIKLLCSVIISGLLFFIFGALAFMNEYGFIPFY